MLPYNVQTFKSRGGIELVIFAFRVMLSLINPSPLWQRNVSGHANVERQRTTYMYNVGGPLTAYSGIRTSSLYRINSPFKRWMTFHLNFYNFEICAAFYKRF